MKAEQYEPLPSSSSRYSDRPPAPPWDKIIVITLLLLVVGPFVFFNGCLFLGWKVQQAIDRQNKLRLESAVQALSPDGKVRFAADVNGAMRLVETATGRVLQTRQLPIEEYKEITAHWEDSRHVQVRCSARYTAMVPEYWDSYLWDGKSGTFTDTKSGKILDPK
jgi:hypothetical protein